MGRKEAKDESSATKVSQDFSRKLPGSTNGRAWKFTLVSFGVNLQSGVKSLITTQLLPNPRLLSCGSLCLLFTHAHRCTCHTQVCFDFWTGLRHELKVALKDAYGIPRLVVVLASTPSPMRLISISYRRMLLQRYHVVSFYNNVAEIGRLDISSTEDISVNGEGNPFLGTTMLE